MTVRLVLLALGLVALPVLAQSAASGDAQANYHEGARLYVDGEMAPAEAAVRAGLALAPDDAKLQALLDLILQDQQDQDGDQNQDSEGDSGDDGQEGDDPEDGEGEDGEQGSEGDEPQDEGDGGQPDEPGDAERDGTDQPRNEDGDNDSAETRGARPGEGGDTPDGEAEPAPGEMSRAQAERLLDAVGGEEQLLLREMRRAGSRLRRGDKDW